MAYSKEWLLFCRSHNHNPSYCLNYEGYEAWLKEKKTMWKNGDRSVPFIEWLEDTCKKSIHYSFFEEKK